MKRLVIVAISLFVLIGFANAQKFKPTPDFLKGQTEINVLFDYSNVVFDGDAKSDYYEYKGDEWVEEWEGKRRTENSNSYISDINDELKKCNILVGDYPNSQYTMIVEVLDCDFGAFAGPMSVPAKLKCTIKIVKTGATEVLASITLKESQNPFSAVGTPIDFDRMYLAFGEMGEEVGEKLVKVLK
ncbi:hypothetical protein LJC30_01795 [Odoribacter sp. OttesenSCG-928-L07]|nr:hypothetical protein [Odoribacter sp. OttesenSCG-928-L07]MDL2238899.1 hypothetical protein [Bacteroidales bacterium OttesenSCG-928-L14]MDL2240639.1 hypothetical protein [Bacteroidales bacterium OttesenSCG-928-K22]